MWDGRVRHAMNLCLCLSLGLCPSLSVSLSVSVPLSLSVCLSPPPFSLVNRKMSKCTGIAAAVKLFIVINNIKQTV